MEYTDEQALDEIRKGVHMLYRAGDVIEVRVPRKHEDKFSKTTAGFFNNLELLAQAIHLINKKYHQTVYTMLNPLRPTWMKFNNKAYVGSSTMRTEIQRAGESFEPRMKKSTLWESGKTHWTMRMGEDEDILKRRWILIDIDAGQPANTNSNETEHADTLAMAKAVIAKLTDDGFPAPALTDSGNGHHVYVRVDLENTADSQILVRRFLKALSQQFRGTFGKAMIDEGMFNAARITKAAGSFVYKGEDTQYRPRRRSHVIALPSKQCVSTDKILEIANGYIPAPGENLTAWDGTNGAAINDTELTEQIEKMKSFLNFYDIDYSETVQDNDMYRIPCVCPNSEEHSMNGGEMETVATISASGALGFCCHHSHCQSFRGWKNFRNYLEETTGKKFSWTEDPVLFLYGKQISGPPEPQKSIIIEPPPPNKTTQAVELVNYLKPGCSVKHAHKIAADTGVARRTFQRACLLAGAETIKIENEGFLVIL